MKRLCALVGMIIGSALAARGQMSVDVSLATMVDDNLYGTADPIHDRMTESALSLGYAFDAELSSTNIAYEGALSYFSENPDRTFHGHTLGLRHSHTFSEEGQAMIEIGGSYSRRFNRAAFELYDFSEYSIYANFKHTLATRAAGKAGYHFRSVLFSGLGDFNYSEHSGFLQGIVSVSPTTTLIVEADLGVKIFHTVNQDTTVRRQHGSRQSDPSSIPGVTQLAGLVRVGQQVTPGTGLSLTGRYQHSVYREARYFSTGTTLVSDEEVFDDHYGYDGGYASVMITQLLPADMRLRLTTSYQERLYASALADNSGSLRRDIRRILTVLFNKQFSSLGFSIALSYDYIVNSSNDPMYGYDNNAVAVRVSYGN